MPKYLFAGMRLPKLYSRRTKRIVVITLFCALMGMITRDIFFPKPRIRPFHPKHVEVKSSNPNKGQKRPQLNTDVTLVTAYLNVEAGSKKKIDMSRKMYRRNMTYFRRIKNPVLAFVDNKEDYDYFQAQREHLPKRLTKIVLINRQDLWPFRLVPRFKSVLKKLSPSSKAHPYLRNPSYIALMHSKVEFLSRAIDANYFKSRFFSWVDISYFQHFLKVNGNPVKLAIPAAFKRDRVLFGAVQKYDGSLSPRYIFEHNSVWLSSGYFSAYADTMIRWIHDYRRCVMNFLTKELTGTDQTVIYAMFVPGGCHLSRSRVQIFRPPAGSMDKWHQLGIQAWQDWQKLQGVTPIRGNELKTNKKSIKSTGLKKSVESKKSIGLKKIKKSKKSVGPKKSIESKKLVEFKKSRESKKSVGLKKSTESRKSDELTKYMKSKKSVKVNKAVNPKKPIKASKLAKKKPNRGKNNAKLKTKRTNIKMKKAKSQSKGPPFLKSRV